VRSIYLDIDGTLVEEGLWCCLIEQLMEEGFGDAVLLQGVVEALEDPDRSGMQAIRRDIPTALKGIPPGCYRDVADRAWGRVELMPFTEELAGLLRRQRVGVVLISGAPQVLAEKVGELFDAEAVYACTITPGEDFRRIVDSSTVKSVLTWQAMADRNERDGRVGAVGNGYNDIGMLQRVGHPVAFEPSEKLRTHAIASGWPIVGRNDLMEHFGKAFGLR
jgi:phosphoserine phosphatase